MPTALVFKAAVAILLGIEAAALLYYAPAWAPSWLVPAIIIAGLLVPNLRPWPRTAFALVAVVWSFLFVFPGSLLMAMGACTYMNGICAPEGAYFGIGIFAASTVLNVVAAVLLVRMQ